MSIHAWIRRHYHPRYTFIWRELALNANDSLQKKMFQRSILRSHRTGRTTWSEVLCVSVSEMQVISVSAKSTPPLSIPHQVQDELVALSHCNGSMLDSIDKSRQRDQFRWFMNVISNDIYEYYMEGRECHHKFLYMKMRQEYKTNSIKHWT